MSETSRGPGGWQASDGKWYPPTATSATPIDDNARKAKLAEAIAARLATGRGRVESQTDYTAIIVSGSKPNHTFHLIVTIFTCGLWALVWLIIAQCRRNTG